MFGAVLVGTENRLKIPGKLLEGACHRSCHLPLASDAGDIRDGLGEVVDLGQTPHLLDAAVEAGAVGGLVSERGCVLVGEHAGGNVRLTGRVKEIINRGGVKFNPLDVEALLLRHPAVAEVAVAPIPDPVLGEKACCFVVTRPGQAFTFEVMRNFLAAEGVGKVKWPERLEIVAAMPITPTRKIIKGELVRQLLARI